VGQQQQQQQQQQQGGANGDGRAGMRTFLQRVYAQSGGSGASEQRSALRGASKATIATLAQFTAEATLDKEPHVCPICIDEVRAGAQMVLLPCAHSFHTACIASWLKRCANCPLCKHAIPHAERIVV
jgi:hypothetical protein